MASTPVQGIYVPGGTQAPATASDMARSFSEMELKSVLFFTDVAARDAKIPTANRKAGMVTFIGALGYHQYIAVDGGNWLRLANPPESFGGGELFFVGDSAPAGTFKITKQFHRIVNMNANGDTTTSISGFSNGVQLAVAASLDPNASSLAVTGAPDLNNLNIRAFLGATPVANKSIRIAILVYGW